MAFQVGEAVLLATTLLTLGTGDPGEGQRVRGVVLRHADGDTLTLQPNAGGKALKVRMVGIDTPELHLPVSGGGNVSQGRWAERAAERLAALAPVGSHVTLETWGSESYGRAIGRILDEGGRDVNLTLVEEGWAAAYVICSGSSCKPGFLENQDVSEYMRACERAMLGGRGIYDPADPLPEQPFEFRMRMGNTAPHRPVGNLRTGRFLAPDRYAEVPLCSRVFFGSADEAARMGFRPAN
jgi:endonuclease YncB( thermonuclease family)